MTPPNSESPLFCINHVKQSTPKAMIVPVTNNGKEIKMELDTGATVSVISKELWKSMFPVQVDSSEVHLTTYTNEPLTIIGQKVVEVQYIDQRNNSILVIIEGNGPALLGRDWLMHSTGLVQSTPKMSQLLQEYSELFEDKLGTVKYFTAHLEFKESCTLKFFCPHSVPFMIREAVETELSQLESSGIIEKVTHSDWAAPIVEVPKAKGRLRICGDYKVTISPVLAVEQYPLPRQEEVFASLAGGKKFSKIDLSQTYTQILLDDTSAG